MAVPRPGGGRLQIGRALALASFCWGLLAVLTVTGTFDAADLKLLDEKFQLRGPRTISAPVAMVEIDDATVDAYGQWPLRRDAYALLIAALDEAGAGSIGIDVLFLDTKETDPTYDNILSQISGGLDRVVHSMTFPPPSGTPRGHPNAALLSRLERHGWPADDLPTAAADAADLPFEDLVCAGTTLAHVTVAVDPDGAVRRLPMLVDYRGTIYPSLSLAMVGLSRGGIQGASLGRAKGGVVVTWPDSSRTHIPIDDRGSTSIDFAGGPDSFPNRHSMLSVLQMFRDRNTDALRAWFDGKLVLVGVTAGAAADLGTTPYEVAVPLVYVHANALESLLTERFIHRPSRATFLAALAVLTLVLGFLFVILRLPVAAGVALGSMGLVAGFEQAVFVARGLDIPATAPLLLPPLCYAAIASYRFIVLERLEQWREKELALARNIQQRLLPSVRPEVEDLDVYGLNLPAQEVGGDYFDWLTTGDNSLAVALGDVTGKGVAASLLMAHLRASFHAEVRGHAMPLGIVSSMHQSLFHATEPGLFATFFLALFPPRGEELVFCNAGHNPAILVHEGRSELLIAGGPPLAILETLAWHEERRPFTRGDVLVLYSDGISEGPIGDDFYGEERLERVVREAAVPGATAARIAEVILDDVRRLCGELKGWDDITLLVVRRR